MTHKGPTLKVVEGEGRGAPRRGGLPIVGQTDAPVERSDAARNRQKILDAARRLMGRRAIKDICMDELARAAGVGKGTLYRRFVDRSSLCMALLDDNERQLQDRVLRRFGLPPGTAPLRRLTTLLDALFDFALENAALLAEANASHRGGVDRFEIPPVAWRRTELIRLMDAAAAERAIPPVEAHVVADMILATLDPELMLAQLARGMDEDALKRASIQCWLRMVGAPDR